MQTPASKTPDPRLLSVKQAAQILGCSVRHVWTLVASGELRRVRIGRRSTRLGAAEVEEFIRRRTESRESQR